MKGFLRRNGQVVCKQVGRQAFLLNLENGDYYDINPTGLLLWKLCDGKKDSEQILRLAGQKLKIKPEKIHKDASRFIAELKRRKLVEILPRPAAAKWH